MEKGSYSQGNVEEKNQKFKSYVNRCQERL